MLNDLIKKAETFAHEYALAHTLTVERTRTRYGREFTFEGVRMGFNKNTFSISHLLYADHSQYTAPCWVVMYRFQIKEGADAMYDALNRALCYAHYLDTVRKMFSLPDWFTVTAGMQEDVYKRCVPARLYDNVNVLIYIEIEQITEEPPLYVFVASHGYTMEECDFHESDKVRPTHFPALANARKSKDSVVGSTYGIAEQIHLHGNFMTCGALVLVPAVEHYTVESDHPLPEGLEGVRKIKVLAQYRGYTGRRVHE